MSDHETDKDLANADLGNQEEALETDEVEKTRSGTDGGDLHDDDANPDLELEAVDMDGLKRLTRQPRIF